MGLYTRHPDYSLINKGIKNPIFINDIPYITSEDRERLNRLIMTTSDTDVLSAKPSCFCGELVGGYVGPEVICKTCGTVVTPATEKDISFRVWVRVPDGVTAFISPIIFHNLTKIINCRGYNILEWMINSRATTSGASKKTLQRIDYLISIGWKRGLNNFIDQFDLFLDILCLWDKTKGPRYAEYLRSIRHLIFPTMLPVPTKAMIIVENTPLGQYSDTHSNPAAINAAKIIAEIYTPRTRPLSVSQLEQKVFSVIKDLVEYSVNVIRSTFCSNKGWLRGHLYSCRGNYTGRAVVVSITGPHDYRTIEVPWTQGVEMLKVHIESKLVNKYRCPVEVATNLIEASGNVYNELIDSIIEELIRESPVDKFVRTYQFDWFNHIADDIITLVNLHGVDAVSDAIIMHTLYDNGSTILSPLLEVWPLELINQGFFKLYDDTFNKPAFGVPNMLQRNPSLARLSAQFLPIGKVKKDVLDRTFGISVLGIKGGNTDFDGDQLNASLIQMEDIIEKFKLLSPHYGIFDMVRLGDLDKAIALPDTCVSTVGNYINGYPNE